MRINWCTVRLCDASRENGGSRVITAHLESWRESPSSAKSDLRRLRVEQRDANT